MANMKILFISMEKPFPDYSGGSKYTWQKIKQLSQKNDIFLVSFDESTDGKINDKEYKKYVKKYFFYQRNKSMFNILLHINKPYSLTSRINKEMKLKIEEIIKDEKIDVIVLDSIHMYYNIDCLNLDIPLYMTQHNVEYKLFASISNSTKSFFKKVIYKFESYKLYRLEKKLYRENKIKGYIFISEEDMNEYQNEIGNVNSICIPPCVDIHTMSTYEKNNGNNIVFSGKMSYEPNITAVNWFVKDIFPLILKKVPDVKFYIVGKDPIEEVKALERDNIIVTGMVNDVKEYLNMAKIVVIPLLSGGGVKIKLFEAIETQNIVITTDTGIQGTCFKNKIDLFVENNPTEFANRCIENLLKPKRNVAIHAQKTLIGNYSFDSLQKKINSFVSQK